MLLLLSLFFYAWGEGYTSSCCSLQILLNYGSGMLIPRCRAGRARNGFLALAVSANVLMLVAFKYTNFLCDNLNVVLGSLHLHPLQINPVHLPIGISFFVFQGISYLIDVHRQEVSPTPSLVKFAMYKSFFPQLIAGPIVRYKDVVAQIETRALSVGLFAEGVERFVVGLGKKVIIANSASVIADKVFQQELRRLNAPTAWLGVTCYALQIYFDFSGYTDMAIGMGKMFGFTFLENFNHPYVSRSIREFWRRWHISLSTWFRDYLYIPLGGNRVSAARQYFNLVLVFFLCGLWHGASWTFIIWGLWNGLFLVLERTRFADWLERLWLPLQHLYALLVVLVGWVFFRADTLSGALGFLARMAGARQGWTGLSAAALLSPYTATVLTLGLLFSPPLRPWLKGRLASITGDGPLAPWGQGARLAALALVFVYSLSEIALGTNNPFIYFRF